MSAHAPRGQGTVELALGLLLFVTILIFGIHFAELSFLSLKTTEAASYAVWTAAGRRVTDFKNSNLNSPVKIYSDEPDRLSGSKPVDQDAQTLLQNFKGLTQDIGGTSITQVFTQGAGLSVTCQKTTAVDFTIPTGAFPGEPYPTGGVVGDLTSWYRPGHGGITCKASAALAAINIPVGFEQNAGGGFFSAPHLKVASLKVCSSGRASGGKCPGKFGVLSGDWALEAAPTANSLNSDVMLSAHDANDPPGPTARRVISNNAPATTFNVPYYRMVRALFDDQNGWATKGLAATRFAKFVGGLPPNATLSNNTTVPREDDFYMSFSGEEHNYSDTPDPNVAAGKYYNTSGTPGSTDPFSGATKPQKHKTCDEGYLPACK